MDTGTLHKAEADDLEDDADLVALLERQCELYRQLKRLSERQRSLIDADEAEPLLELLSERQRLVDRLTSLDARMVRARQEWARMQASVPPERRARLERLLAEARGLLGQILDADRRDSELLSARKTWLEGALSGIRTGRQAQAAYQAAAAPAASRFVDQTDEQA